MAAAITREMTIAEITRKFPETVLVFLAHGLLCLGCQGAQSESLAEGAATHDIDLDALLSDLNEAVEEQAPAGGRQN